METYITDERGTELVQALQQIVEIIRDTIKRIVEVLQPFLQNITDIYKREMEKQNQRGYRLITAADIAEVSERLSYIRYGGAQCFYS